MNTTVEMKDKLGEKAAFLRLLEFFPRGIREELDRLCRNRRDFDVSEIRLRTSGVCSAVAGGKNLPLLTGIEKKEMAELVRRLCLGSLHAHRATIAKGFLSVEGGIRVGIVGEARYEEGRLVGIGDVSALCFRIPTGRCEFALEVYKYWFQKGRPNMLVFSAPAGGKTTLLRALAREAGGGRDALGVVVVDERREFIKNDYEGCFVDILSGYGRDEGTEIALRTMSPQLIIIDELGSEADAEALLGAYGAGVPVIASAHGRSVEELRGRRGIGRLIDMGMFGVFVGLENKDGRFFYTAYEP